MLRLLGNGCVAYTGRQSEQEVHAGCDAFDWKFGELPSERGEQAASAPPVDRAGAADVAVVMTAAEELGEGELVERRGEDVDEELRAFEFIDELERCDNPSQPEGGR